jgi:hypothetical protein
MRRQSTVRGRLALLAVIAAGTLGAAASPAHGETTLAVEAGWGGRYRPGQPVPVRVEITADRLIHGTLLVRADDGTETSLQVEVPGGSVKEYFLVVPTSPLDDEVMVQAALQAGDERASGEDEVEYDGETELVGLLPAVMPPDLPGPAPLPFDAGTAAFVEVTDRALAEPTSLAALGTVVAGADEISQLPPEVRLGLLAWVGGGGRLLIDAPTGSPVTGLPDAWQPGARGRVQAGMGEVRHIDGAAAAGRWADVIEPTPALTVGSVDEMAERVATIPISDAVARDAGLRLTTPGWLLGFLVAYVLLVGPVAWIVLRAVKRPGLAWVAVPVVAVVFAGASFAIGRDLRAGTQAAHGSIVVTGPGGADAVTFVGTVSKNGGDGRIRLPAGWSAGSVDQSFWGLDSSPVTVSLAGDGATGVIPLDAGEFGVLRARGPLALDGGLEVEATATGSDTISGVVRNTTDLALEDVAVFVGPTGARVGELGPGEEKSWDVDTDRQPWPIAGNPAEVDVWPDAVGWDRPINPRSVVNIALWTETASAFGPNFLESGSAVAAGWTRDAELPARADDDELDGRTLILGRSPVGQAAGEFNAWAVRHEVLRNGDAADAVLDDFGADRRGDFSGHVVRAQLPEGAATSGYQLRLGADVSAVQVWSGTGWNTIDDQLDEFDPTIGVDPSDDRTVPLPDAAIRDGIVHFRVVTNFSIGPGTAPQLRIQRVAAQA